jgi:GNAT superfamily N-acetyltransferase
MERDGWPQLGGAAAPRWEQRDAAAPRRKYDAQYREEAVLSDGTRILMRRLGPDDGELLTRHFAALSAESRHRRFLGGKSALSDQELRFYTHVDGEMHLALVAVRADNPEEAIGVARFIRSADAPEIAEPAAAVVDAMQAQGVGKLLLMRLGEAALERGVKRFRWDMLSGNSPVLRLVQDLAPSCAVESQGPTAVVDVPLVKR